MRSARRAMFCAATALVALARILSACASSVAAFFSALARSRRRRFSSVSRCFRYASQPRLYWSSCDRFASRWNTLLTVARSSSTSWLMTTNPPG